MNEKERQELRRFYTLHIRALDLFDAGRFGEGLNVVRQMLQIRQADPDLLHTMGMVLTDLGAHEEALSILRGLVTRFPENALYVGSLGTTYLRKGALAEAQAAMEQSLGLDPECPFALANMAACLLVQGKAPERAERMLRKAALQLPEEQSIWHNLGRALEEQGKLAEADDACLRAIQLAPQTQMAKASAARRLALARRRGPSGSVGNN